MSPRNAAAALALAGLLAAAPAPGFSQTGGAQAATGAGSAPASRLDLTPPVWTFGQVYRNDIARIAVEVTNRGSSPLGLSFVPTCPCLTVSPASASIPVGGSAVFALAYDSKDDVGKVDRGFILKSEPSGAKPSYYEVRGIVRDFHAVPGQASPSGSADTTAAAGGFPTTIDPAASWSARAGAPAAGVDGSGADVPEFSYYYTPGCRSCERFLGEFMPALEKTAGRRIALVPKDVLDTALFAELDAAVTAAGTKLISMPVLVSKTGAVVQGDEAIRAALPALVAGMVLPGGPPQAAARAMDFSLPAVIAAGLVDGVNPCAFTTLIFLLSSLALAGRSRRETLVMGLFFTGAVFLSYLGIGLGFLAAFRALAGFSIVARIIRWALAALLAAMAVLSLIDYRRAKAGRSSDMILQLPGTMKKRIHDAIRTRIRSTALAASAAGIGFLVSIFEFACTGQVYLPILAYLARTSGAAASYGLLLAYNLGFIAPLAAVFIASWFGLGSARLAEIFKKRVAGTKLALAAVFALLAVLTVLS